MKWTGKQRDRNFLLSRRYIVSNWHTVKLSNCQTVKLSNCQTVKLSNCRTVELSNCQTVKLSNCQTVKLSNFQTSFLFTNRFESQGLTFSWSRSRASCRPTAFMSVRWRAEVTYMCMSRNLWRVVYRCTGVHVYMFRGVQVYRSTGV